MFRKIDRKWMTAVLFLLVLLFALCMPALAAENEENVFKEYSGNCGATGDGSHLTWAVSTDGKTLTITGSGAMANFANFSAKPWDDHEDTIETVVFVEQGGNITHIGDFAFYNCENLTLITLPDSLRTIGKNAFSSCSKLASITLPDSLTSIGMQAFSHCSSLASVRLPNGLTTVGFWAFSHCTALSSVQFPDSLTAIESFAFEYCESLTEISIPAGVTTLSESVFSYCSSLQKVHFASTLHIVERGAFEDCTSLTNVSYDGTMDEMRGIYIYINNEHLKSALWDCLDGADRYGFDMSGSCGSNLTWAVSDDGTTLTITGSGAMYNFIDYDSPQPWADHHTAIKTVVFVEQGDGITYIGKAAFSDFSSLASVTLPDHLTDIGSYAFSDCTALTEITIPSGVTELQRDTFADCSSLTTVHLSNTLQSASTAFARCDQLAEVYYDGLIDEMQQIEITGINNYLKNVPWICKDGTAYFKVVMSGKCGDNLTWTVSEDRKTMTITGSGAMYDFANTTSKPWTQDHEANIETVIFVEQGGGITHIGEWAFDSCFNLSSVTLPEHLTTIGNYAFAACNIPSITFPDSLTSIGNVAFFRCEALTSLQLPDSVVSIGESAFSWCTSLSSVQLPDSLISIGEYAFERTKISEITIPSGTTELLSGIFFNNESLRIVNISNTLRTIGMRAFYNCPNLSDVYYDGTQPEAIAISFAADNNHLKEATWHFKITDLSGDPDSGAIIQPGEMPSTPIDSPILIIDPDDLTADDELFFNDVFIKYDKTVSGNKKNTITYNVHLVDANDYDVELPSPENGAKYTLFFPYPEGLDQYSPNKYRVIIHHTTYGTMENPYLGGKTEVFKSEDGTIQFLPQGISVKITSLSPFVISWEGDGAVPTATATPAPTPQPSSNVPVTGDESKPLALLLASITSLLVMAVLLMPKLKKDC